MILLIFNGNCKVGINEGIYGPRAPKVH